MDTKNDIVQIKFKVKIPKDKWLSKISQIYPELRIKILSMILIDKELGNSLIQIEGYNLTNILDYLKQILKNNKLVILYESSEAILINLNTRDPLILNEFVEKKVPIRFPILIEKNHAYFEIVSIRSQIDNLLSGIEEKSLNLNIKSIGRYKHANLLTSRQTNILIKGWNNGFFDYPRKINMTQLANKLNISTSSLSETLKRIYKKIVEHYLTTEK